jgi:hypothetical protein
MTTATAKLDIALITMASQGSRPRCADPVDHQLWTSEEQHDRDIAAQWCSGFEVPLPDHKNRALDFCLRRPHVVPRRIWPRVTTTQELALCNTSRTIRFQERRQ